MKLKEHTFQKNKKYCVGGRPAIIGKICNYTNDTLSS